MKVRKLYAIVLMMSFFMSFQINASDAAVHRRLYRQASRLKEKRDKVKNIYEASDESFKSLVIEILDEQLNYGVERNRTQRRDHEDWIYYTAMTAGKLRIPEAAPKMQTLFTYIENSIIRGTLLHCIGLTKNEDMIPWLNLLLTDFNDQHRIGRIRGSEEMVIGVLKALSEFKSVTSFRPVFYAAMPNYPDNIRNQAMTLFLELTDDPAGYAHTVINFETDYSLISQLLNFIQRSNSPDDGKANTALITIERLLSTTGLRNVTNASLYEKILDDAVKYLGELKTKNPKAVSEIQRKWNSDILIKDKVSEKMHSILINIEALQAIATEESALALNERLRFFNDMIKEGSAIGYGERDGGTILFAIIDALGAIGVNNTDIIFELKRVSESSEYGEPHRRRANEALAKIQN